MVVKHLAVALLGSALIAAPAFAQTSGTGSTSGGATGGSSTTMSPGASTSGNASMGATGGSMTQMQPGQWRASQIEGLDVYNQNNEKIGDISEMLVDESGKIQAVVIGVGGFLGIGERDVAISFDQVKFVNEPRANASAANTNTSGAAGTGTMGAGNTAANNTTAGAPSTTGSTTGATTGTTASNTGGDNANRMAPDHAMVNMTKDQLQGMPEFKYNR